ncbi:hypothetical protein F0U63_35555 [Cystobacter fuscus]|nr:hypothetical protein F0U63_35555 [Cystobacter fuscus]
MFMKKTIRRGAVLALLAALGGCGAPGLDGAEDRQDMTRRPVASGSASSDGEAPDAPSWAVTGSMELPRMYHTATLLPMTGQVLVAGGFNTTTEAYEPRNGEWWRAANTLTTHRSHTATLLLDGRVLLAGGGQHPRTGVNAELYDEITVRWNAAGRMITTRFGHTATLLPDGRVLVVGGTDKESGGRTLSSAELYDPGTNTWTATGSLTAARTHHAATLLPDGRVLVVGGDDKKIRKNTAELYDPSTGTWSSTTSMWAARTYHSATLLSTGQVLVAGGEPDGRNASAELYDPATQTWSSTANMNEARRYHTATLLPDGGVLVAGGYHDSRGIHFSAELYDPATGTWSSTASMNADRFQHTATLLPNGSLLVVGGVGNHDQSSAEVYAPRVLAALE